MIKVLFISLIFLIPNGALGHMKHYENIKKIQMDVFKDGKIIGFCNYEFFRDGDNTKIKNKTEFNVKLLNVKIFSIISNSTEIYNKDNLISFTSKTLQNKKKKYVNLKYLIEDDKFLIDGSSYKGTSTLHTIQDNNICSSFYS